jgi:hypothetical protein
VAKFGKIFMDYQLNTIIKLEKEKRWTKAGSLSPNLTFLGFNLSTERLTQEGEGTSVAGAVHTAQRISCYIGARTKLITVAILGFT